MHFLVRIECNLVVVKNQTNRQREAQLALVRFVELAAVEARADDVEFGSNEPPVGLDWAAPLAPGYFNYRKVSIYGGSNEIQRNIIAKAVLGF